MLPFGIAPQLLPDSSKFFFSRRGFRNLYSANYFPGIYISIGLNVRIWTTYYFTTLFWYGFWDTCNRIEFLKIYRLSIWPTSLDSIVTSSIFWYSLTSFSVGPSDAMNWNCSGVIIKRRWFKLVDVDVDLI